MSETKYIKSRGKVRTIGESKTFEDLFKNDLIKATENTRKSLGDVPFAYGKFAPTSGIQDAALAEILGDEAASELLNGIEAHKQWIGGNDIKINFTPELFRNSSNLDSRNVYVNAVHPGVIHHELGHLATTPTNPIERYFKKNSDSIGPVTSLLALVGKKMLPEKYKNVMTALSYAGAAIPPIGYGERIRNEYNASKNAKDFIATHYDSDTYDKANEIMGYGIKSHMNTYQKPMAIGAATLLAAALGNKLIK